MPVSLALHAKLHQVSIAYLEVNEANSTFGVLFPRRWCQVMEAHLVQSTETPKPYLAFLASTFRTTLRPCRIVTNLMAQ